MPLAPEDIETIRSVIERDAEAVRSADYLGLLRRQTDGAWLWSTDMAVSELPVQR